MRNLMARLLFRSHPPWCWLPFPGQPGPTPPSSLFLFRHSHFLVFAAPARTTSDTFAHHQPAMGTTPSLSTLWCCILSSSHNKLSSAQISTNCRRCPWSPNDLFHISWSHPTTIISFPPPRYCPTSPPSTQKLSTTHKLERTHLRCSQLRLAPHTILSIYLGPAQQTPSPSHCHGITLHPPNTHYPHYMLS